MKRIFKKILVLFSQESLDKTISGGIKRQFVLLLKLILCVLVICILITLCVRNSDSIEAGKDNSIVGHIWTIYNTFIDPGNLLQQNGFLNRLLMAVTSLLGTILLGGIFISMCSNVIERRVDAIRSGRVHYKSIKDHYVIIGYSNIIISLIKEIHRDDPTSGIIVMSNQDSEIVRHKLQSQLNKDEEQKVYIYFGNIDSIEELEKLNINKAKEVYILGEEGDYGRDSKNIQCVHSISILKGEITEGKELPVYTQFNRLSTYGVIQKFDIIEGLYNQENGKSEKKLNNIYFRPFNIYENWARRLWSIYSLDDKSVYYPLDYNFISISNDGIIKNKEKYIHLVIVGFSGMGQAILLEAIRICHYANYDDTIDSEYRIRTKISIIDNNIEGLKNHFISQIPNIDTQIDDIDVNYINADVTQEDVRNKLVEWSNDENQLLTIAVCISDPDESINIGLNLPYEIYKSETKILIRQEIQTDLGKIIHRDKGRYKNIKTFGMLDESIAKIMLNDELASYVNQEYTDMFNSDCQEKEYIKTLYQHKINNEINKYKEGVSKARKSWINLDENMRWANRYQIDAYLTYLHTLGYSVTKELRKGENEVPPEQFINELSEDKLTILMRMEKYRWNAERTIEGWKYGEKRDNIHRIHPLIIPFNKVNLNEKLKDKQVIINLPYLLNLAGYKIIKYN